MVRFYSFQPVNLQIFGYLMWTVFSSAHFNNSTPLKTPKHIKLVFFVKKKLVQLKNHVKPT